MITLDFETEGIVGNPILNPPKPVGIAIWDPALTGEHQEYEPITEKVVQRLRGYWATEQLLFHNASFDLAVGEKHLDLPFPAWQQVHDTQYLVYLADPHSPNLSLKPSADKYLDLPPEEQDHLKEWILANVPQAKKSDWGAYICEAPFELVSPYAKGDVLRTRLLFDLLHPQVPLAPYDRERQLSPLLVAATRRGVPINRPQLEQHLGQAQAALHQGEQVVRTMLGAGDDLNVHSSRELAKALEAADAVTGWALTPTGKKSTAKDNLMRHIKEPALLAHLNYVSTMQTVVGTFMEPWLAHSANDGRVHPSWNQVRQPDERSGKKGTKGTRTGRLSSSDPNFQNVIESSRYQSEHILLPDIPDMRSYVQAEDGGILLKRDWSGQEMRILAHYEEGLLYQAFNEDPDLDVHEMVRQLIIHRLGKSFPRKHIKETGFGMIYGMGARGLAAKIGCTIAEARELQAAYHVAIPGVGQMQRGTKRRGRTGEGITTWGGRHYKAEQPRIIKNSYRSFEYKLLNYLIQGSGADQCKQVMVDWHEQNQNQDATFLIQVHDEIIISSPQETAEQNMEQLRACMEHPYFDVPMRTEGFMGSNWGLLEAA